MMHLNADYFNQTRASNETTRMLYVTGTLKKMQELFAQRLKQDQANIENDVLKFYYWSDHDDSIIMLCNALSHQLPSYPSFASQIIFEFWRTGLASEMNYTVTARVNDQPVSLLGPCGGAQECHFEAFSDWLSTISFFRRDNEYLSLCQNHMLSSPSPVHDEQVLLFKMEESQSETVSETEGSFIFMYEDLLQKVAVAFGIQIIAILIIQKTVVQNKSKKRGGTSQAFKADGPGRHPAMSTVADLSSLATLIDSP